MASLSSELRLGVNIDHVATIRNARGGEFPDPVRAAQIAADAGADGITAHLREDRRHISDSDISRLAQRLSIPINLEMAATSEMKDIALRYVPHAVCIVPEKREERTTEGGLEVADNLAGLSPIVKQLSDAGIRVSLFIEPDLHQLEAAVSLTVPVVEIHTGTYCNAAIAGDQVQRQRELERIESAAEFGFEKGLEIHAGHGLDFNTVEDIARIGQIKELNIGHFLIGEAIFIGLKNSIHEMRSRMNSARGIS